LEDLKSKLFGSSGVRGLVNKSLTPVLTAEIGLAVTAFANVKKVLVARDTRVSGPMLEEGLVSGLLAGGADVTFLGVIPTPVLAYLTKTLGADIGLMITASHNPPQYNGVKIFDCNGIAYGEKNQGNVEKIIQTKQFRRVDWRSVGKATFSEQDQLYADMVRKKVKLHRNWRVVVDPGCGATYRLAPMILKELGCRLIVVNAQPDGFFPARSPEPNVDSLKSLALIVKELGADVGVAYDGDGDRVAFIDENGVFADFDRVLAAYAGHVVRGSNGGTIVTTVEASMCVEKMVEAEGGKVRRTKVGDVYVSEAIKKYDAVFGGEPCGAWIHPQFHCCPDGILSAVLSLKALEEKNKSLSEFLSEVPQYPTLRKNVACNDKTKYQIVEKVGESIKSIFPKYRQLSAIDGVRLDLDNGWVLIRSSGTEPLIRITVEGESLIAAKQIMQESLRLVRNLSGES